MGKLDDLSRDAGANVRESMGIGVHRPSAAATSTAPARWRGVVKNQAAASIPLDLIERDETQPREEFDEEALGRLAESLKARGQLQPCRVRWDEGRGAYVVIVGERRWRAARMAGLPTLSCVIDERAIEPAELLAIQLIENALREDLQPIERAKAYRRLLDANGWTTHELARELAISQTAVVQATALLNLPESVQDLVDRGELALTSAYQLSTLPADEADQVEQVAAEAVAAKLSRDQVTRLVRQVKAEKPRKANATPDPVSIDLGNVVVVVKWKRGQEPETLTRALRRALKRVTEGDDKAA